MARVLRAGQLSHREPAVIPVARPVAAEDTEDALVSGEIEIGRTRADVSTSLPEGTVLLRVLRRRSSAGQSFHLDLQSGGSARIPVAEQLPEHQQRPEITLAATAAKGEWATVLQKMRSWSATKRALRQWLSHLYHTHGDRLRLVIWDETGFQIPWELFFHESKPGVGSYGWLGAGVELIRWTTVHTEEPIDWSTGGATVCQGPILSFVDPTFPRLDTYLGQWSYEPFGSVRHLMRTLGDSGRDAGLVQVWAHGTIADDGGQALLGGESMDDLGCYPLDALGNRRTLVFLNTCSSAELMDDARFGETATRSFAEIFLRRGARGVIATSGQVGKEYFVDLLDHLIDEDAQGTQSLSSAMRSLRAQLAQDLPELPFDAGTDLRPVQRFVYGSMFQYIGHLDTFLRLLPREGPR